MTVTFKDVAKLAGVSTQTVSRVTNGSESVSEKTRQKVNDAIKQLGYIPNKGAQMLSRAKSQIIGLITLDMSLHGAALIANGVRMQAHELNYGTALSVVSNTSIEDVRISIRELISQQVDCIILNVPIDKDSAEALQEQYQHLHLVFIDVPEATNVNIVCGDHYAGAQQAVEHLMTLQRKEVVLITGPDASSASQIRHQAWITHLAKHQATVTDTYEGNWQANSGYLAIRDCIAQKHRFDSVLVANDQMALGVLRALHELGINVPNDVSVIGFDGITDSAFFTPPLTTIKQDFTLIGKQAVIVALTLISDIKSKRCQEKINVAFIERESTASKLNLGYQKEKISTLLNQIQRLLP